MFRLFHKKMKSVWLFKKKLRSICSFFTPQRFVIISVTCYINKSRKLLKWKMNLWLNRIFEISFKWFLIVYFISYSLYWVLKIKKKNIVSVHHCVTDSMGIIKVLIKEIHRKNKTWVKMEKWCNVRFINIWSYIYLINYLCKKFDKNDQ